MNRSKDILNELQNISPFLAGIEKVNVFSVPDNYFDDLAERITTYTILNKDENINFSKTETLTIPEGYFDTLSDSILAKIKRSEAENTGEELQQLSPLLYSLKDKNVFTIPAGYFENLSSNVLNKLNQKPAKIVSINKARIWWKYAAAAVITGTIAISSLQIFNSSPDMKRNTSVVTESSGLPDYIKSSFQYKTPDQVDQGISSLSDDAIVKYLEKHGNIMDDETLTNDVDPKTLPTATDYLTDDKALDNYLNSVDAKSTYKNDQ